MIQTARLYVYCYHTLFEQTDSGVSRQAAFVCWRLRCCYDRVGAHCVILTLTVLCVRRQILADLEDSQLGVLPPSMAEEAQTLRREWEARNRQHPYEPIDYSVRCESTTLSPFVRPSA